MRLHERQKVITQKNKFKKTKEKEKDKKQRITKEKASGEMTNN